MNGPSVRGLGITKKCKKDLMFKRIQKSLKYWKGKKREVTLMKIRSLIKDCVRNIQGKEINRRTAQQAGKY